VLVRIKRKRSKNPLIAISLEIFISLIVSVATIRKKELNISIDIKKTLDN
jgi:hypothetical protein